MTQITLNHSAISHHPKKTVIYSLLTLLVLSAFMVLMPNMAHAADIFAGAKTQISESTNSDSALWFAITVVGLAGAAITGFLTKNWPLAIGGFFAGIIFLRVGAGVIGLA